MLPREGAGAGGSGRGLSLGLAAREESGADAPWEREPRPSRARMLGVALPSRVGRYRIQAQVDSGGSATVYRALDPRTDDTRPGPLDVTVLHSGGVSGPDGRSAFLARSRELLSLRHPGIAPLIDAGHDGAVPYLVMSPLSGQPLAVWAREQRHGWLDAALVVVQVARALDHAHGLRVVHGELTPARILVDGSKALLTGFPTDLSPASVRARARAEDVVAYTAPEVFRDGPESVTFEADQYALGAVFFQLLCHRAPFDGPVERIIDEARNDGPIPPRDWNRRIPRELERICLKAMARDPFDRYRSCRFLADDLERWLVRASKATRAAQSVRRAADWARRRPAAVGSAVLTLAGVVATTVMAVALIASTAIPTATALGQPIDVDDPPRLAQGSDTF